MWGERGRGEEEEGHTWSGPFTLLVFLLFFLTLFLFTTVHPSSRKKLQRYLLFTQQDPTLPPGTICLPQRLGPCSRYLHFSTHQD